MEGLPVLRRIVLNGRDNFDWSTRHATLQIRNPGIYAVHGSEDRDKGRVEWKFTYMVQSRISPSTGEIVLNERVSRISHNPGEQELIGKGGHPTSFLRHTKLFQPKSSPEVTHSPLDQKDHNAQHRS